MSDTQQIFYTGDDWNFRIALRRDGMPEDVSGSTIQYVLVRSKTAMTDVKDADDASPGAIWESGVVACPFAAEDTTVLDVGTYTLQVTVTYAGGDRQTWASGPIVVAKSLTPTP